MQPKLTIAQQCGVLELVKLGYSPNLFFLSFIWIINVDLDSIIRGSPNSFLEFLVRHQVLASPFERIGL